MAWKHGHIYSRRAEEDSNGTFMHADGALTRVIEQPSTPSGKSSSEHGEWLSLLAVPLLRERS